MDRPAKWWRITDSNILTDIAVWLILLLPLLIYLGIYEPFGFGRYAMFMFFLVALLIGSLLAIGRLRLLVAWWKRPVVWLVVIWWLVAILASFTGVNPGRSWWGTVTRAEGLFFLTGLIILGISLLVLVRREASWLKIFSIMTWVGAASGLYALLQPLKLPFMMTFSEQSNRASGMMGNPIFLGQLLLLTIFLTLYFIYASQGKLRWAYLVSLLLQVTGLLLTFSRGPLAGLVIGALVWLVGWFFLHRREQIRVRWSWLIGGLATTVVVVGSLLYQWPQQWQRLFVMGDTVRARLSIWETAWRAIKARPWLGYGNENARYGLAHFYQSGLADISMGETTADRAHNLFLDQLLTNGWIGLIIMVVILGYLFWVLWRRFRFAKREGNLARAILIWSLISTIIAYLTALMFAFDVVTTSVYLAIMLAGIIFLTSSGLKEPLKLSPIFLVVFGVAFIGLTFFDIKYLVPAWRIGSYVKSAKTALDHNNYQSANQFYAKAQGPINPYRWPYLTTYPPFARQYALLLIEEAKQPISANAIINDGIRVLNNIQKNEPDRVGLFMEYPVLYAVQSYVDPRSEINVRSSFDELIKEFPNHEYLYVREAQALIGIGKYSEAKQVLDQAASLKSIPRDLWFWRAVNQIQLKDRDQITIINDLRQAMTTERIGLDPDVLRLVVNYLVQARQWQTAAYYQEKLVDIVPQDLTELSNLLTIYKSEGRLDDVVRIAREIIALDPTKQAEVQKFLQSIGRTL